MTVRIEQAPGARHASIHIDGVDISHYVHSIDIALDVQQMPEATVRILPASLCIDLPDEAVRLVHDEEPSVAWEHVENLLGAFDYLAIHYRAKVSEVPVGWVEEADAARAAMESARA